MLNRLFVLLLSLSLLFLFGCVATRSTITAYDASGNIISKTESCESIIKSLTASTKGKTVVMWEDGWAAYISISSGTTDDPTPHGKIFAGKINKGVVSIRPEQQNLSGIAQIIKATKSDLSAGISGIHSSSDNTDK